MVLLAMVASFFLVRFRSLIVIFLTTKSCPNEKLPKNVQKISQNAFWGFLAASQKNVQKVSQNAFWGFLAASQKNVQKVSGKCPVLGLRRKNVRNEN